MPLRIDCIGYPTQRAFQIFRPPQVHEQSPSPSLIQTTTRVAAIDQPMMDTSCMANLAAEHARRRISRTTNMVSIRIPGAYPKWPQT